MGKHEDVLRTLTPVEVGGSRKTEVFVQGKHLDALQALVDTLHTEAFPDKADELLADWERVCGITPDEGDTLSERQGRVLAQLRARGGLSLPYFESVAEALGHTVEITCYKPTEVGVFRAGDELCAAGARYIWKVEVTDTSLQDAFLEALFEKLRPAYTAVEFHYAS